MNSIIQFRIFYGNSTVVIGSSFTDWNNSPDTDIQVVILYENTKCFSNGINTRQIMHGSDRYWFDGIEWGQSNELAISILVDHPDAIIKEGKLISDEQYNLLLDSSLDMEINF